MHIVNKAVIVGEIVKSGAIYKTRPFIMHNIFLDGFNI